MKPVELPASSYGRALAEQQEGVREMMQIMDCEQGSPEWFAAGPGFLPQPILNRHGVGAWRRGSAEPHAEIAGEIITGDPMDSFSNAHTERGHEMEPEARNFYAFRHDVDPQLIGFIRNGNVGASPDSLIGENGLLEIKTKLPHLLIDVTLRGEFPTDHKAQCQGQLWIAEREWDQPDCYWPKMEPFIAQAYRDEYIKQLARAVDQFNDEWPDHRPPHTRKDSRMTPPLGRKRKLSSLCCRREVGFAVLI